MNIQAERRSSLETCGCLIQLPDEEDPCCYRIKCDEDRYITIGIDGCTLGLGYNYYYVTGSGGGPGGWVDICSPYGGLVKLRIHSEDYKCSCGHTFCQLFPTECDEISPPPVCDLPLCP